MRATGLSCFPVAAAPVGWRELVIIRPCVLVYEVEAEIVRILRVWHSAQDR
jgi:plasmid stabilization system protein ParE